mgnify:CR=1 FL=1
MGNYDTPQLFSLDEDGDIVIGNGNLETNLHLFRMNNYQMISLEDMVRLSLDGTKTSVHANTKIGWVKEGIIYLPNGDIFITKNSPILDNLGNAAAYNKVHKEYYLSPEDIKKALSNAIKIKLPKNTSCLELPDIESCEFGKNEITKFLYGQFATQYGEHLSKVGVKGILFHFYEHPVKQPFARQLYISGVGFLQTINGDFPGLHTAQYTTGVKNKYYSQI